MGKPGLAEMSLIVFFHFFQKNAFWITVAGNVM